MVPEKESERGVGKVRLRDTAEVIHLFTVANGAVIRTKALDECPEVLAHCPGSVVSPAGTSISLTFVVVLGIISTIRLNLLGERHDPGFFFFKKKQKARDIKTDLLLTVFFDVVLRPYSNMVRKEHIVQMVDGYVR